MAGELGIDGVLASAFAAAVLELVLAAFVYLMLLRVRKPAQRALFAALITGFAALPFALLVTAGSELSPWFAVVLSGLPIPLVFLIIFVSTKSEPDDEAQACARTFR